MNMTPNAWKILKALCEATILRIGSYREMWVTPEMIGGHKKSNHSAYLKKMIVNGYVERRVRMSSRESKKVGTVRILRPAKIKPTFEYRTTKEGQLALARWDANDCYKLTSAEEKEFIVLSAFHRAFISAKALHQSIYFERTDMFDYYDMPKMRSDLYARVLMRLVQRRFLHMAEYPSFKGPTLKEFCITEAGRNQYRILDARQKITTEKCA